MMKTQFKLKIFALSIFAMVAFSSCSDDDNNVIVTQPDTITDLAVATPDLSTLVAALQRVGLDTTLRGNGPFTVFAPTNAAFEELLTDLGASSLDDIDDATLEAVLLNHVVSGESFSSALSTGYVSSLSPNGPDNENLSLYIDTSSGVAINGISDVSNADVDASNGVVHIVDAVITLPNIVDHAVANADLSELVSLLTAGGNTAFTDLLSDDGEDFTVFAPLNSAFNFFTNPNSNDINAILSNHVIVGTAAFADGLSNSYVNTAAELDTDEPLSLYTSGCIDHIDAKRGLCECPFCTRRQW